MADDRAVLVLRLPARTLRDLVADLVSRRHQGGEARAATMVTLHLRSGRNLTGQLVDLKETALVIEPAGRHGPSGDAVYLEVSSLEAVTVHDAATVAGTLSAGKLPSAPAPTAEAGPPPTRLWVKRRLNGIAETIAARLGRALSVEVDWTAVPEEGEPLRALAALASEAESVLGEIAAVEEGRAALAEKVSALRFANGPEGVILDGTTLQIAARLEFGDEGRLGPAALRAAIEKLL